jgi:hypothetical protein
MPTFVPALTEGIEEIAGNGTRWLDMTLTSFLSSATLYPSTVGMSRFVGNPVASMGTRGAVSSFIHFDTHLSGMYLRVKGVAVLTAPMTINIHVLGTL